MGKVRRRTKGGRGGAAPSKKEETTNTTNTSDTLSTSTSNEEKNSSSIFSYFDWGPTEDATLLETFLNHPLIKCMLIALPFAMYYHYDKIILQYPHVLSTMTAGVVSIRPTVNVNEERQVLIVGSQLNKGSKVASEMKNKLGLEIGQNNADSMSNFVRDGTVSWLHIIRYLAPLELNNETARALDTLCGFGTVMDEEYGVEDIIYTKRKANNNLGFHPKNYRAPKNQCSYKQNWSKCWSAECYQYLMKEWGCCAMMTTDETTTSACETPFRKTLHQVQNPLRNIEDIVTEYCPNGIDGSMDASFLSYASSIFYASEHDFTHDSSCVEVAANFVILYNQVILDVMKKGKIDGMYRLEESSVCDVAELAGFFSSSSGEESIAAVYGPNHDRVLNVCQDEDNASGARKPLLSKEDGNDEKEKAVHLSWADLRGGIHGSKRGKGDTTLEMKVKNLFKELGYDASLEA